MPTFQSAFATSEHSNEPQIRQWSSLVGIITAIIGNILISFALNTQRYAHIRINREYKFKNDQQARKARKNLPKALRNYGTAVRQEEIAEERARINANAPGPGEGEGEDQPLLQSNGSIRHSDDTLKPKEDDDEESEGRKSYLKSPWWWLGIILMTIGEAGNFLAYGFAPASIVSPLGVVALISNCLIAPLMLKECFRQRDFWGVVISVAGAVTVVLSANQSEKQLGPGALWKDVRRWEFLVYVLITIILIGALMFASPRYGQRTILIDLGLVGLFGGYTALSTKGVASLLSGSLYRVFTYPIFYVLVLILIFSAIMQIRYLNRALQIFDSTQVIPVQFVLFTLSVIIGSAVLYRDFRRTTVDHAVKFVIGCLLTFCGVYLITSGRKRPDAEDGDSVHEEEQIQMIDEEAAIEQGQTSLKGKSDVNAVDERPSNGTQTPPKGQHSRSSSQAPSVLVTPATDTPPATVSTDINNNPWTTSTDHVDRAPIERPRTPVSQTMPESSSQTPFFTPATTLRPQGPQRTISSPDQPQTPTRDARGPSPPKAEEFRLFHSARGGISRLIPGPLMPPLSSSLSGIIADSIRRGEGSPSPINLRATLRRHRALRDTRRRSVQADGDLPVSTIPGTSIPSAHASDTQILGRTNSEGSGLILGTTTPTPAVRPRPMAAAAATPKDGSANASASGSGTGSASGSLKKSQGRLRAMSETLSEMMSRARGKAPEGAGAEAAPSQADDDDDDDDNDTPDGRLP